MGKSLHATLKELIHAPTFAARESIVDPRRTLAPGRSALPRPSPRREILDDLFRHIERSAQSHGIGWAEWLSISTATLFALDSPGSLAHMHRYAVREPKIALEERVHRACLMREVGLKCIGFIGIPKVINNLAALRAAVEEDRQVADALPTTPRRNLSPAQYDEARTAGRALWDSIYQPKAQRLESVLARSHPDLGHFILQQEYGPLFAPPSSYLPEHAPTPVWEVGRIRTSLVAIAALRAQGGVGPQVTSHVWGLLKARGASEAGAQSAGLDFLTTQEGAQWTIEIVNESTEPKMWSATRQCHVYSGDYMESIHALAQQGDVAKLAALLGSGTAKAMDRDEEGVTPLHWAAINSQHGACRLLIDAGADVNAPGGELKATPLQWCARNGDLPTIQLLLERGGDPLYRDAQGFNVLHLVTHSSSVMPIVYMLQRDEFTGSRIDIVDPEGHTALMWAAYQGDAISVEILLQHGASVDVTDKGSLTPLHWAVVYGNKLCIRRLLAAGASLTARDANDQTPEELAVKLNTIGAFDAALNELGWDHTGKPTRGVIPRPLRRPLTYAIHITGFGLCYAYLNRLPWFLQLPAAAAALVTMHITIAVLCTQTWGRFALQVSDYYQSLLVVSLFWPFILWLRDMVHVTADAWLRNAVLGTFLPLTMILLYVNVNSDPGFCPKPASEEERRQEVIEMAKTGQLNGMMYCVSCMARRPMRSRHCHLCGRCVARGDHHCPWITNCVGVGNHRLFVVMLVTVQISIFSFYSLAYTYFKRTITQEAIDDIDWCPLPRSFCVAARQDGWIVYCTCWIIFAMVWLLILLAVQLLFAARQLTTYEASNLRRHGYMASATSQREQSGLPQNDEPHTCAAHKKPRSGLGCFMQALVGTQISFGAEERAKIRAAEKRNPFNRGMKYNLYGE
ncbi:protein S-acyltransferase [Malassezia cuniculi]|uniref:protein S-acyltransferase n=1 Tax=Malassezia cuniculi TaxID=948313 RepID=A0AAF0EQX6_9BASI|nr:protein S-acyltransferase [Malassezia cuniculi]